MRLQFNLFFKSEQEFSGIAGSYLVKYLLPLILSFLVSCHTCLCGRKQIYGLVLVSSWHSISFHCKMVLVAGKAPASGTWTSELLSSNHKEDMVSKENWFLAKEEAQHFRIQAVFLCLLFKTQWIFQLNKTLKMTNKNLKIGHSLSMVHLF